MNSFVERHEVISCIKDKDYTNIELNKWCHWAISKYDVEVIDLIINLPDFVIDNQYIKLQQVNRFIFFNDIKRFEYFLNKVGITPSVHGYAGDIYAFMKDICWYNKIDFLRLIIDIPELDFLQNGGMIIHQTYKQKNYEILSMLLTYRDEVKNDKKLYNKYSHVLRSSKLKQLKKRIYTTKQ